MEMEKVRRKSLSPEREQATSPIKIPNPRSIKCDECQMPFKGFVSFLQHGVSIDYVYNTIHTQLLFLCINSLRVALDYILFCLNVYILKVALTIFLFLQCKFSGPKTKCRICDVVFENYEKFRWHLKPQKIKNCKAEYRNMFKKYFPDAIIETHDSQLHTPTIAKGEENYDKYYATVKAKRCLIDLPKYDKQIPLEKISKCKARLERKRAMKIKIKQNSPSVQNIEYKQEIKEEVNVSIYT